MLKQFIIYWMLKEENLSGRTARQGGHQKFHFVEETFALDLVEPHLVKDLNY